MFSPAVRHTFDFFCMSFPKSLSVGARQKLGVGFWLKYHSFSYWYPSINPDLLLIMTVALPAVNVKRSFSSFTFVSLLVEAGLLKYFPSPSLNCSRAISKFCGNTSVPVRVVANTFNKYSTPSFDDNAGRSIFTCLLDCGARLTSKLPCLTTFPFSRTS